MGSDSSSIRVCGVCASESVGGYATRLLFELVIRTFVRQRVGTAVVHAPGGGCEARQVLRQDRADEDERRDNLDWLGVQNRGGFARWIGVEAGNRPLPIRLRAKNRHRRSNRRNKNQDRKSTRLNSSHSGESRMPSSA